jgi:WD40 repeat protein
MHFYDVAYLFILGSFKQPTDPSIISDAAPNPKGGHASHGDGDAHSHGDSDKAGVSQYFVSVHRNVTSSLLHSKITLTYAPPATSTSPGGGPPGGVRFSRLAWSNDSKLLAAVADGELDDEDDDLYRSHEGGAAGGGGCSTPNMGATRRVGTPNGQQGVGSSTGQGFGSGGGAEKFATMAVWEWSKDKVVGQCHFLQNPKERIECNRLTFCSTDKNVLTSTGHCSLKQWSVPSTGGEITAKSLLPPNKSQEHFVDHAWMTGKSTGGSDVADRRLVVLTGGGYVSNNQSGGGSSSSSSGAMTPGGCGSTMTAGGGNHGGGSETPNAAMSSSTNNLLRSRSQSSVLGGANGQQQQQRERAYQMLVFQPSTETPGVLELVKQASVALPPPLYPGAPLPCVETLSAYGKGFVVGGSQGFLQVWDRTDVAKDLYSCVKTVYGEAGGPGAGSTERKNHRLAAGGGGASVDSLAKDVALGWGGPNATFASLAVAANDEVLVCATKARELVSFPLGSIDLMADAELAAATTAASNGLGNGDPTPSAGLVHFSRLGGTHAHGQKVTCMAVCLAKPLLATGSEDETVRIWDYSRWQGGGEVVLHSNGTNGGVSDGEPVALALHPSGQQILVGYRDRVRLMGVLHRELKPFRELPITKCRALAYTPGGNMFAAASSITVFVYDALTLTELQAFTGHVAPVKTVTWASNGLSLYSSGLDGNVYGWDVTTGERIDELAALNNTGTPCGNGFVVMVPTSPYGSGPATGGRRGIGETKSRPGTPASPAMSLGLTGGARVGGATDPHSSAGRAEAAKLARMATALTIGGDGSLREVTWLYGGSSDGSGGGGSGGGGAGGKANGGGSGNSGGGGGGSGGASGAAGGAEEDVGPMIRQTAPLISIEAATGGAARAAGAAAAKGRGLLTCLAKCHGKPFLFAGASNGCVHVYAWPLRFVVTPAQRAAQEAAAAALAAVEDGTSDADDEAATNAAVAEAVAALQHVCSEQLPPHLEVPATAAGTHVEQLLVSCDDSLLFVGGSDGSVLVFKIDELDYGEVGLGVGAQRMGLVSKDGSTSKDGSSGAGGAEGSLLSPEAACEPLSNNTLAALQSSITSELFNSEVVQVSLEDLEERQRDMEDMKRKIEGLVSENEFQLSMKTKEWEFKLREVSETSAEHLEGERERYAALERQHRDAKKKHGEVLGRREELHMQTTLELESSYEFKLTLEMERYDLLSEEIEKVQQKCEALLVSQSNEHQSVLREHEAQARRTQKELATNIEKLTENEKHNKAMFREVLDQQEAEYETELQALIVAAQEELAAERGNTGRMRVMVQEYQSRINDLKLQMDTVKGETHRVDQALAGHKVKNQKMEATLEHFKRHMQERESTLEDKEAAILELRRRNTTLDNFRFVLDHRVQQLVEERGPISKHINGLEGHIDSMYEELEREYSLKKLTDQQLDAKAMKINTLASELGVLRGALREKEAYINAFKRDLCGLVSLGSSPKDVEDGVRDAYYRYVKEERPRNGGSGTGSGGGGGDSKRSVANKVGKNAVAGHLAGGAASTDGNALFEPDFDEEHDGGGKGKGAGGGNRASKGGGAAGKAGAGGGGGGGGDGSGGGGGGGGGMPSKDAVEMDLALREAYHQRDCVEKLKDTLARKLEVTKKEHARSEIRKLEENSGLMSECNALRQENLLLRRKVDHLRQVMRHFEHDDKKRREDAKLSRTTGGNKQMGGRVGGGRRPSTAGAVRNNNTLSLPPAAGGHGGGAAQAGVGPTPSIDTASTDPFAPIGSVRDNAQGQQQQTLLTVKRVATPVGNGGGGGGAGMMMEGSVLSNQSGSSSSNHNSTQGRRASKDAAKGGGAGKLSARAGRARVLEQNLNLTSQLDENERIIAMQKLEIGQLKGHLGVATHPSHDSARSGGAGEGGSHSSSRPREVINFRGKKPGNEGPDGTHGLYSPEDPSGPFNSKQAMLQER